MPRVIDKAPHELSAGEYGRWNEDGAWYGVPPGTDLVANLASHYIEEHWDGTISVSPSILVGDGKRQWHGWLRRGQWDVLSMTANVKTAPVKAFETTWDSGDHRKPGAYVWRVDREGRRVGIAHACPCGCEGVTSLSFRGLGRGAPEWDVIGEWPNVTLSPSIGIKYDGQGNRTEYHWHGYLERGWFVNERNEAPN